MNNLLNIVEMPKNDNGTLRGHFGVYHYPKNKVIFTSDYRASCQDFIQGYMARENEGKK